MPRLDLVQNQRGSSSAPALSRAICTQHWRGGWTGIRLEGDGRGTWVSCGLLLLEITGLLSLWGLWQKAGVSGSQKPLKQHRAPCRMLPAAVHLQTSEVQEPNATNLGKGRMSRRLPLKLDDLPRPSAGINVCHFSLLTSTPCCALWGESCALLSAAFSSSLAAHTQRS